MKHLFAFSDKFGIVDVESAEKNVMNQRFFYDENKTCELILRSGNKNIKHFAFKKDATIIINGNNYPASLINESEAHFNFKMELKKNGYFIFNEYKIHVKNVKLEFIESKFRFDVKAELLCGTPCVIEVVKTSKTSSLKQDYIRKNEILTFEIFLDYEGNQNFREFNTFGNELLENTIRERIEHGIRVKKLQSEMPYRKSKIRRDADSKIDERIERIESEIDRIRNEYITRKSELRKIKECNREESTSRTYNLPKLRGKIYDIISEVRELRREYNGKIKRINECNSEIQRFEIGVLRYGSEIRRIEREFEQTAKNCKIEWFTPKWMNMENTLQNFKYWTT